MHSLFDIYLEAINPMAGNYRAYSLSFGKDLLNEWIVQIQFGRIGRRGTIKNYSFNEFDKAVNLIKSILKKRFSSVKRIGCDYKIKGLHNQLGILVGTENEKIKKNQCAGIFL
jgi:hypothetical protein